LINQLGGNRRQFPQRCLFLGSHTCSLSNMLGPKHKIYDTPVEPGTNKVVTRFHLNTDAANTSNFWAYVCAYMQNGIEGLDPDRAEPRDANDVAPYNLALRLAPRVQWPADMDLESRTAP
ncbi:DUF6708 domain-containing protein, partial [Achromobacter sp. ACRQX]|uniref:DUF6708 domain-containing protein n=1 Tax=Achromobacter sp. ACRQX TaxID=2918181 RepID=UPI001EF2760F